MEGGPETFKRRYDFRRHEFKSTEELVAYAEWLVGVVGEAAGQGAVCAVETRRGVGIEPDAENMPLEKFRERTDEFRIMEYGRLGLAKSGDATLSLSFDITCDRLRAILSHVLDSSQVEIFGSDEAVAAEVRRRIKENHDEKAAKAAARAAEAERTRTAETARRQAEEAAEQEAAEARAAKVAKSWRGRLSRARERLRPLGKWAWKELVRPLPALILGGVAVGVILLFAFGIGN